MPTYTTRYVHKISPRDTDTGRDVTLPDGAEDIRPGALNRRYIGAELRKAGVLLKGDRLLSARMERDGRIVAFPAASIWHSIILTPKP